MPSSGHHGGTYDNKAAWEKRSSKIPPETIKTEWTTKSAAGTQRLLNVPAVSDIHIEDDVE